MAKANVAGSKTRATLEDSLVRIAEKLAKSKSLKPGVIVFTLTGSDAGNHVIECSEGQARVVESSDSRSDTVPLIEVIGDAKRVHAILSGEKDAREQFLAGGFRVRGDLRYLSDVGLELGLLKEPL
ncbi:SCP2 sterol-binding domain-containing protein [Paraburkholderia terrae]|uniref:SCP2 sterol-binding domain-containing protein n=1 Tax=Paraburkholderia terrae TaxID=311230 RepID=UPI0020500837|nr:SCP2 sterol-binding domain-containing protein [Paraburkholderia terrae]BDC46032.1 hypothetical protein PTKU15_93290 [Paraburkholderia terrae]